MVINVTRQGCTVAKQGATRGTHAFPTTFFLNFLTAFLMSDCHFLQEFNARLEIDSLATWLCVCICVCMCVLNRQSNGSDSLIRKASSPHANSLTCNHTYTYWQRRRLADSNIYLKCFPDSLLKLICGFIFITFMASLLPTARLPLGSRARLATGHQFMQH